MKKSIFILLLLNLGLGLCWANAQCNLDLLIQKSTSKLGDYTFLKVYKLEKKGEQMEYSYVFSGNTSYMLALSDDKGNEIPGVEVTIYDNSHKLVSTNKLGSKVFPAISYNCKVTGIYYMTFSLTGGADCGVCVLGFKK